MRKILLATLVLVLCMVTCSALADGKCGDNLTWTFEEGVLTISGTGDMYNYAFIDDQTTDAPWFEEKEAITRLVLTEGVTSVGDDAFAYCSNLVDIEFPESLIKIGSSAFSECHLLPSVNIPSQVTNIGPSAFSNCFSLSSVNIPNGVTSINSYAFYQCPLKSLEIPEGVTHIANDTFTGALIEKVVLPSTLTSMGDNPFEGCMNLTDVSVDEKNTAFFSKDGVVFTRNMRRLVCYPSAKSLTGYNIPEGVMYIADGAFNDCDSLTSITIPDGVIYIGDSAFYDCDSLTSITIPGSVQTFEDAAFSECDSLTSVAILNGTTSIGRAAFQCCSSLTSIVIPDSVTRIGGMAFDGCEALTSITIPDGVTSIESITFNNCESLTSITIPDSVTSIGWGAFSGCESLKSVTIPNGVTSIEYTAFNGCTSLTSITIPAGVTSIGWGAFNRCSGLTSITIPDSVTSIGEEAFAWCSSLKKAIFTGDAPNEDSTAFKGAPSDFCVYYPEGASGWSTPTWHGYKAVPYKDESDIDPPRDTSNVSGTFKYAGMMNKEVDAEAEYYYRDDYFRSSSEVYNPSLATMSLCLELSTWSSYEEKVWANKTKNVRALLDEIGFEAYAQNDLWSSAPTTNSIGVVAARKQIDDSTLIALVIRGGGYKDEWGGNLLVGEKGVHEGFAIARNEVLKFLKSYIRDQQITGRIKLWIVGYSRGGAVANMVGSYLNHMDVYETMSMFPDSKLATSDMYCYTFEAPQGTIEFNISYKDLNIHNIINANDIVTLLAPSGWGFVRANTNSHLLPTIATKNFTYMQKAMLKQYEEVLEGVEVQEPDKAKYNISEYAQRLDYKVTLGPSFYPGTSIYIDISVKTDEQRTQAEVLNNLFNTLTRFLSRKKYTEHLQEDMSYIVAELMTKDISGKELLAHAGKELTANGCEKVRYMLAPMVELSFRPANERVEQVKYRCVEVVGDFLKQYDLTSPHLVTEVLGEVLAEIIVNEPESLLDAVLSFAASSPIQAHNPEITLAWLRIEDPNYVEEPFTADIPEVGRVVRIKCPVDIRVYDSQNQLVASVINGVCYSTDTAIGCAIEEDGAKILHLPGDEDYKIQVKATGNGVVNYTVSEYNVADSTVTRVLSYFNVDVQTGEQLVGVVPALSRDDYQDEEQQGSDVDYRLLTSEGKEVKTPESHRGTAVVNHFVTVMANNEHGVALGGGRYLYGTFAQVEAIPTEKSSFLGWYINGQLVSTDAVYNFAVNEDITLTAHFKEVPNGDADANGEIDVYDALRILQYVAGWDVKLDTFNADANVDGAVTIDDALLTLEYCFDGDMAKAARALQAMLRNMSISPLQIVEQPADQYAMVGQQAEFTVSATGDGLTYQWYINRNDSNGWRKLNGATNAIYVTTATEKHTDGYQYSCVVTDVYGNELMSDAAVLHVTLELPNTGDGADPALWLVMVMLSAISMAFMFKRRIVR